MSIIDETAKVLQALKDVCSNQTIPDLSIFDSLIKMMDCIKDEIVLRNYILNDIISYSSCIYGEEQTIDIDYYNSLSAEQLLELHKSLRKDYNTYLRNGQNSPKVM